MYVCIKQRTLALISVSKRLNVGGWLCLSSRLAEQSDDRSSANEETFKSLGYSLSRRERKKKKSKMDAAENYIGCEHYKRKSKFVVCISIEFFQSISHFILK